MKTFLLHLDAPFKKQYFFQPPATRTMELLMDLHCDVFGILMVICTVVFMLVFFCIHWYKESNFAEESYFGFVQNDFLEATLVMMPMFIVISILAPSMMLLYNTEYTNETDIIHYTLKVMGEQWLWSYEFNGVNKINESPLKTELEKEIVLKNSENETPISFKSYMVQTEKLLFGTFSLLEVDNRLFLPLYYNGLVKLTSIDVMHSWAMPSLGMKMDCCPGRINQVYLSMKRNGIFYGQCSELCGANHAYMPIVMISKILTKLKTPMK